MLPDVQGVFWVEPMLCEAVVGSPVRSAERLFGDLRGTWLWGPDVGKEVSAGSAAHAALRIASGSKDWGSQSKSC